MALALIILFSVLGGLANGPRMGWNDITILMRLSGGVATRGKRCGDDGVFPH
ncbi:MAG: hypothetical protein VCE75_03095 [Alphaproteobacteria bacterium]